MSTSLLYATQYPINDKISIRIPTVDEILKDEDAYYSLLTPIVGTPYDFMVQLDNMGKDFSQITEFELFLMLFPTLQQMNNTQMIFGNLDLSKFVLAENEQNKTIVLYDPENDIVIDRAIHDKMCRVLRKINHLEKNNKRPGNEEGKKFMLQRMRIKQKNASRRKKSSQLEDLIIAMVNTEQYKYDYQGTLGLTIYQFNSSVYQIVRKINYDNTMIGCYAGTVNMKDLSQDDLNWITQK